MVGVDARPREEFLAGTRPWHLAHSKISQMVDDLWFFPPGLPHSIQGLNPDGCEFMLVFDDGAFSESATVLLSDTIGHLPPEVLAKNFVVSQQTFENVPKEELFIFQADLPGSLEADQKAAAGTRGTSPHNLAFRTMEMPPTTAGDDPRLPRTLNLYRSPGGQICVQSS